MRIAMIGHKRFGSREGGVEVVVTELSRRLAALGHEVTCYDRSGKDVMTGEETASERVKNGVHIVPVRTIDVKGLAALSSSFFGTLKAIKQRPDVIHYHAEGPCVPLRLAHWMGIRTVATIHGLDWQRAKWGRFASAYIKLGERTAAKCANEVIVLSRAAQQHFLDAYGRDTVFIPNGVDVKNPREAKEIVERWGLSQGSYVLFLGRIVPEKGVHYLIEAFKGLDTEKNLVIAGAASDTSEYARTIRELAAGDDRILFTGFVKGAPLEELYSNAYCYVLPSDVEGMPLSLLEAMAYGCACVTSDIPECADVLSGAGVTFYKGNAEALGETLMALLDHPEEAKSLGKSAQSRARKAFTWDSAVKQTVKLYEAAR